MKRGVPVPDAEEEAEANAFAMALLMPEEFVRDEIKKMGGIDLSNPKATKLLAQKFQVSEMLMGIRIGQIFDMK